jgi:hypothetical protein
MKLTKAASLKHELREAFAERINEFRADCTASANKRTFCCLEHQHKRNHGEYDILDAMSFLWKDLLASKLVALL